MTASAFRPGSYQRIRHATASSPSGTQERSSRPYAYLATSAGSGLGPHPASRLPTSSATSDGTAAVRPTYRVEFTCRSSCATPRLRNGKQSRGRSSPPHCSSRSSIPIAEGWSSYGPTIDWLVVVVQLSVLGLWLADQTKSRESVWAVVTQPGYVKQWQYGSNLDTDWSVGSPILLEHSK